MHVYIHTYIHVHLNFIPEGEIELKEAGQLMQLKKVMGKMATN